MNLTLNMPDKKMLTIFTEVNNMQQNITMLIINYKATLDHIWHINPFKAKDFGVHNCYWSDYLFTFH